ncbi:single-stranded DNA-binding protein [Candidatus Thorarchaeota archaeon]|jgi:replication factor A1|nr:MAG: single-stranded DNA-binding protein [Candidatus Thorarchaeota archaeon]
MSEYTMSYDREPVEATIAQLEPRMKNVTIKFKVMEVGDAREVSSRKDGSTHRVADAIVGDESGIVRVPLWDATIDELEVGKTYTLTNGYTGLFKGNLQLNVGRYGELQEAEEAIDEINEEVDMSEEEHDDPRRRNYGGGGRSGGYGGRDRRSGGRDRRGGGSYGSRDRSY